MNAILHKPTLWTYGEAARVFGLPPDDGLRTIRTLVRKHGLTPKAMSNALAKGLDRSDLEVLAVALNTPIDWEGGPAAR